MVFFGTETFFNVYGITPAQMAKFFKDSYRAFCLRLSKIIDVLSTVRSWDEFLWFYDVIRDVIRLVGTNRGR